MIKDAIILAAGKGSRMKLYNKDKIKPLVEVKEKTLIGYTIEALERAGVTNIHVIANDYENLDILKKLYPNINIIIHISNSKHGAPGAIYMMKDIIDTPFILADCDVVANISDYAEMINYGNKLIKSFDGLVASAIYPTMENNHYLVINNGRVVGFEKEGGEKNIHGGFMYVFSKKFMDLIENSLETNDNMAYILDKFFHDNTVYPMFINDIGDVDYEEEIKSAEKILEKRPNVKHQ